MDVLVKDRPVGICVFTFDGKGYVVYIFAWLEIAGDEIVRLAVGPDRFEGLV
jgi:hypothetical protein